MSHHGDDEHQQGSAGPDRGERSRPEEILEDRADEWVVSDEEAVLAYNANAERPDTPGAEGSGQANEADEADEADDSGTERAE
ncbi:hypothetical protein E7744_14250 [Citricoccus sp. SGAir0253]|uniref:hypothetical protein n=1 Tax=Citricoccus sp. SGAir0253 TaxID=2567881 RepID=UPI0010CD0420|nr:hypothetical protein [Citricoccus sp. SGAir0253]QCU79160.1 hypothetical protein E7744_14250 [Citricoccus sp. SGAir0253]